jgi:hypothetical protein
LLPVPYFHLVFTLPDELGPVALRNKRVFYGLLFQAVSRTLLQIAKQPKHLGAEIGFLAVLHTWGQNLQHHPHLHCVVPAGGLALDGQSWVAASREFFLPVRVLSRVFRGKFIALVKQARQRGRLVFPGKLQPLVDESAFEQLLDRAVRHEWVVYAKPPFGGSQQVFKYLARYTHRVAISNSRIAAFDGKCVAFRWKDYADGNRQKTMKLAAEEFVRRFLMHVLPQGFSRIRYYGFLANRHRQQKLAAIRALLTAETPVVCDSAPLETPPPASHTTEAEPAPTCPVCRAGRIRKIGELQPAAPPQLRWLLPPPRPGHKSALWDTS